MTKIKNCKKCDLYKNAGVSVPYIGSEAKYVILGESPANGKLLLDRNKSAF
jgi:uracil-DNA glycosylase